MHTLTAVPAEGAEVPSVEAKAEAWTLVERGYREALEVRGISQEDRGLFLRQIRRVQRLKGEGALRAVIGENTFGEIEAGQDAE